MYKHWFILVMEMLFEKINIFWSFFRCIRRWLYKCNCIYTHGFFKRKLTNLSHNYTSRENPYLSKYRNSKRWSCIHFRFHLYYDHISSQTLTLKFRMKLFFESVGQLSGANWHQPQHKTPCLPRLQNTTSPQYLILHQAK